MLEVLKNLYLRSRYLKRFVRGTAAKFKTSWIKAETHAALRHLYDTSLPQNDEWPEHRKEELAAKRRIYEYAQHIPGGPQQVKVIPEAELFSDSYKWDISILKMNLIKESKTLSTIYGGKGSFKSIKDLKKLYRQTKKLGLPISQKHWTSDTWFGAQRLQGCNPVLISLAKQIPPKLNVDPVVIQEILGGISLQEAVDAKRIFKIDLKILKDLPCAGGRTICSPIALFYVDKDKHDLLPLCIQLNQDPSETNPVFYPTDPPYTWLIAKMYYNNADSAIHQSVTHLVRSKQHLIVGFTHIIMEGTVICTHRNLSPAHPMFKLMAPHFLFLLAINKRGLDKLINLGGWVDKTTVYGVEGMFEIMRRKLDVWKLDEDPVPPADCARRGVLDKSVLPYYPYRDDAVAVYALIEKYVRTVVTNFYDSPDKIEHDYELQSWATELVKPRDEGGCGLNGVAGNGKFTHVDQIISVISALICTCSVGHAASNFMQYDEYGFPPNYPSFLLGEFPTQKEGFTEKDIFDKLPPQNVILDAMVVTRLLSTRGTQPLGDFEVQYLYDPVSIAAAEQLRQDLRGVSDNIRKRNQSKSTKYPYPWLDPDGIPNSISI